MHGSRGTERQDKFPAFNQTCDNYSILGHFKAVCQSNTRVNAMGNKDAGNEEASLGTVGVLPIHGSFQVVH